MKRLLVVRHGQASWGGSNYDELSPLGITQSRRLGAWLSQRAHPIDAIWTGPLQRQLDTARHVAAAAAEGGVDLPAPRVDEALRELALPALFKRGYSQLDTRLLEDRYPELRRRHEKKPSPATTAAAVDFLLEHWARDGFDVGDLENFAQFSTRVGTALARIASNGPQSGSVLVITSACPVAMMVKQALSTSPALTIGLATKALNSGITEFEWGADGLRLLAFNSAPHLQHDELTVI